MMIQIQNFTKTYNGTPAVSDLTLSLNDGEVFGLIGHNGAGKSTTIKSLCGILPPTSGHLLIDGIDIWRSPLEAKKSLAYISDSPDRFLKLTAGFYWSFLARIFHVSEEDKNRSLAHLTERFAFTHMDNVLIEDMSHGMRQKVFLIGALLFDPSVWVLDEPMTGLDPQSAFELKKLMREHADAGHTVLFSTHVLEVAEKLCDRIAILQKGRLLYVGSPDALKAEHHNSSLEEIYLTLTGGNALEH